jgi:hypothetical protein
MYNESSKFVELLIEDNVIRELDKQKSAANDYVQSVIDAHNIFNERNATVFSNVTTPCNKCTSPTFWNCKRNT